MRTLFAGIPLGEVSTSMTINSPAAMLLAFYVCVGEEQGVPRSALRGTIQTDILKEYIAQKEYIFPPEPSMRLVTDMVEFCTREMPLWHPISISGYHIREAGSTAAQELAFTLQDGFTYVEWALERGLAIDEFAPRLSFFFNAHLDFFEEIAKYRAARRIWATVLRDRYGAKDERSLLMRFHAQTAGVSLTAQQPEVNIVRTAIEALAAVLGGTQSLHTNSYDEALALPTEDAVRIALRTQQVIAHEIGVVNAIDPLGGSYHVEQLTNELEAQAYAYFEQIEERGGMVEAIKQNFPQAEIAEASFRYQSEVEARQRLIVGVNAHTIEAGASRSRCTGSTRASSRAGRARPGACGRVVTPPPPSGASPSCGRPPRGTTNLMPVDHPRRAGRRDDGRDVRRPPRGVGHLARDPGVLRMSLLSDEQREILELVRLLARERIKPRAAEIDASHEFPWDIVELYREQGIFGLLFDEADGGTGTGTLLALMTIEEISKVCATSGLILAVQELGSLGLKLVGLGGAEGAVPAEARLGRVARGLRADRGRIGLGLGRDADDGEARRRRLRDRRRQALHHERRGRRASTRCSRRPIRRPATTGSRRSSSRPARPGSRWRGSSRRWGSPGRRRASSSSTVRGCRWRTGSARRGKGSRSRCASSIAPGRGWRRRRSGSPRARPTARSSTRGRARRWGSRSRSIS